MPTVARAGAEEWIEQLPRLADSIAIQRGDAAAIADLAELALFPTRDLQIEGWTLFETRDASGTPRIVSDTKLERDVWGESAWHGLRAKLLDRGIGVSPVHRGRMGPVVPQPIVIVRVSKAINHQDVTGMLAEVGLSVGIDLGQAERWIWPALDFSYRIRLDRPDGLLAQEIAARLARYPVVVFAETSDLSVGRSAMIPSDPLFGASWHFQNTGQNGGLPGFDVGATAAWDASLGAGARVLRRAA
jgi:hypothetical protein